MRAEGTRFRTGVNVGVDISWTDLRARYDAVVIATGALAPRDLPIPGRDLPGVHFAMDYLVQQNRVGAGDAVEDQITARHKHVVVLGGGDTGVRLRRHGAAAARQEGDLPRHRAPPAR